MVLSMSEDPSAGDGAGVAAATGPQVVHAVTLAAWFLASLEAVR
jgi:hypothetical protein